MIDIKTPKQIKIMQQGGHILATALFAAIKEIRPGASALEIDKLTQKLIIEQGAKPGPVPGYDFTTCICVNDVVVHGIPNGYKFQEGDVVSVDCWVIYKGLYTDMSESVRIKNGEPYFYSRETQTEDEIDQFLKNGKLALEEAIKMAKIGNHVGHISKVIYDIVQRQGGYSIVRNLIGHGVGKKLHEPPEVPGYLADSIEATPELKEGMTIAVEIIYNMGKAAVVLDPDGWTIRTKDGKVAGLYERSIAITKDGPLMLTK